MIVRQLKKLLENIDDERLVVLSSDHEGNHYNPMSEELELGLYNSDGFLQDPDEKCDKDSVLALILYPGY